MAKLAINRGIEVSNYSPAESRTCIIVSLWLFTFTGAKTLSRNIPWCLYNDAVILYTVLLANKIMKKATPYEPRHDKTNKMAVRPAKSQISLGICPVKKDWVLSYPLSAQRRLWSDWADARADLSSLGAHSFCWFCHVVAHIPFKVMDYMPIVFLSTQCIIGYLDTVYTLHAYFFVLIWILYIFSHNNKKKSGFEYVINRLRHWFWLLALELTSW